MTLYWPWPICHFSPRFIQQSRITVLLCAPFTAVHYVLVCLDVFAHSRWGRDGYVSTRRQQQSAETKAGWFIAPYWEHKSHLQCCAFKRPASWQHLPFINDWAEPPMEPETTKLTHSQSYSSFVSPLSLPSCISFQFLLPILSHAPLSLYPLSPCFYLNITLLILASYLPPPQPRFLHLQGMMGCSHHIPVSASGGDILLKLLKWQQHCHQICC